MSSLSGQTSLFSGGHAIKTSVFTGGFVLPLYIIAVLVSAPAVAEPARATKDWSSVLEQLAKPGTRQAKRQLDALVHKQSADWEAVEALLAQPGLDDVSQEYLRHELLIRVRAFEPDASGIQFVTRLRDYESKVYVLHDEGPLPIAVYPVASAARGTLSVWHRRDVQRNTSAALTAGDMSSLRHLEQPGSDEYAGVLAALQEADPLTLAGAARWLSANSDGGNYYEARAVTSLNRRDASAVAELLRSGRGPAAMRLLRAVRTQFDANTAFDVLLTATGNPEIGSSAVFEIDALRTAGLASRVDEYLLAALGDQALGATAATVVARRDDPRLLGQVAATLAEPRATESQQARAVLALTLADSPYARRVLENAARKGHLSDPGLQQEVAKWLQR